LSIRKVEVDFDKDNLSIENVFLNNILNAEKFIVKQPFKEDWTELRVSSIKLGGFNLQKYLDKDSLLIDHVKINKAILDSRNAGDLKRRPDRIGLLMHHWFRSFPGHHDVRDIRVVNSRVKFKMYFEKATKSGLLDIENISASVDRITNIKKGFVTHVNGRGSYLGKNNLSLYVKLNVHDKNFKYNVNATAKHINLPDINSLIRPINIMFLNGFPYFK